MNRFRFLRLCSGLVTAIMLSAVPLTGTSIRPPDFAQLVAQSGNIVRARIDQVRPYADSYQGEALVRTEVTLNVLETWAGEVKPGGLKIHLLGGEIPGLRLEVGAMPTFDLGKEVILFLHPAGRFVCPTVGWGHGKYQVDRSGADGVARVRRSNGLALEHLEQISHPIDSAPEAAALSQSAAGVPGMTLDQFRLSVRRQIEPSRQIR